MAQMRVGPVSRLRRLHGCDALECRLRQLVAVQGDVAQQLALQIRPAAEVVGVPDIDNEPVEAIEFLLVRGVRDLVRRCSISNSWHSSSNF